MLNTLSGRFLILTTVFVMLAEVLIFVPSISRFRQDYLEDRLERAQIASLALLADDMIESSLERELLENAGVYNVVLRRDEMRQLVLSSPIPRPIGAFALKYAVNRPGVLARQVRALVVPNWRWMRAHYPDAGTAGILLRYLFHPVRLLGLGVRLGWDRAFGARRLRRVS